jgi:catabolite repression protein CreC
LISIDFVFSPDVKYVAAISEDGCLRVIDALAEQYAFFLYIYIIFVEHRIARLVDCYAAYFGSLTCVAWSPDGRFIIVSPISAGGFLSS